MMGKRAVRPRRHRVRLFKPSMNGLSAEAWSYGSTKSRELFVQLLGPHGHIVTARVLVPR